MSLRQLIFKNWAEMTSLSIPVIYNLFLTPNMVEFLSLVQLFALCFQNQVCKWVFPWHFTGNLGKQND